jgi:hypothetical protein
MRLRSRSPRPSQRLQVWHRRTLDHVRPRAVQAYDKDVLDRPGERRLQCAEDPHQTGPCRLDTDRAKKTTGKGPGADAQQQQQPTHRRSQGYALG